MEASSPEISAASNLASAVSGPIAASEAALSAHSRAIPSGRDFHFFRSFVPFRSPTDHINAISRSLLSGLVPSSSSPLPSDPDDALSWLIDLNDDLLERFDASMDEFQAERSILEEGRGGDMAAGGFQMVYGKAKRKKNRDGVGDAEEKVGSYVGAKMLVKDKKTGELCTKVPFHIPSIERPQVTYRILVDNSNLPFEHVWLETDQDGSRFLHPLEKLSAGDFVDRSVAANLPVVPISLEDTPFKLVEELNGLRELAMKLRHVSEFAVDLEHNQYRSFQGLTCLMQISTRSEDFVVDTLKLRIQIGPHLREVFKDPSKRKVMHGADRDILWLQRDFGIYVCNLFDTGQASRVLQLERNSLEFLLRHYCGVTLNKEYQNADWRLRPIPDEMLKYAREDTHYLLYLYDLMRQDLLAASENGDSLIEVYKRSYDVCFQLYEKELLTDTSYLHIYRLREADFNSEQLAVVAALYAWRDSVARAEDESTGFVLPNRALLEIARQLPASASKLRRLVKSKHPLVERSLGSVVSIIKGAINNASAFQCVVEQLNEEKLEKMSESKGNGTLKDLESLDTCIEDAYPLENVGGLAAAVQPVQPFRISAMELNHVGGSKSRQDGHVEMGPDCLAAQASTKSLPELNSSNATLGMSGGIAAGHPNNLSMEHKLTKTVNVASVQVLKKPTGAFGALLGGSSTKQRHVHESSKSSEQEVARRKLEQIRSSVMLPFHTFSEAKIETTVEISEPSQYKPCEMPESHEGGEVPPPTSAEFEEIIPLGDLSDDSSAGTGAAVNSPREKTEHLDGGVSVQSTIDGEGKDEYPSLSELSSSFQKCFNSLSKSRSLETSSKKPQGSSRSALQLEPFDYAAARKQVSFGQGQAREEAGDDKMVGQRFKRPTRGRNKDRGSVSGETGDGFEAPRRRQAFPPSGNRNATFR